MTLSRLTYFITCTLMLVNLCIGSKYPIFKRQIKPQNRIGSGQYIIIAGRNYFIDIESEVDWNTAAMICRARNMSLVSLQTEEKYRNIMDWINENAGDEYDLWVWTSGKREPGYTWWVWTGVRMRFIEEVKWQEGQPSIGKKRQACANLGSWPEEGLDDDPCEGVYIGYMCERIVTPAIKPPVVVPPKVPPQVPPMPQSPPQRTTLLPPLQSTKQPSV